MRVGNRQVNDDLRLVGQLQDENGANGITHAQIKGLVDDDPIPSAEKGSANGVAELGADSKVPTSQLPDAIVGAMNYKGVWNANTNSPSLSSSGGGGDQGDYYKVSVAGSTSIDGISSWEIGDWIINNGSTWDKIDNSELVSSVAGKTGAVTLDNSDVGLGNVDNVQQMPLSYLDTDEDLTADSDSKVPSQQAVKAYVDNNAGGVAGTEAFSAYNVQQATTTGYLNLSSEHFDIGNNFANHTYTVPATGIYHFSFSNETRSGDSQNILRFYVYVNGSEECPIAGLVGNRGTNTMYTCGGSVVLSLSANDTVKIYCEEYEAGSSFDNMYSQFSGYRIA